MRPNELLVPPWQRLLVSLDQNVLVDDVIAAVDIECFAGDQPRRVVRKEGGCYANIVNAHETARGSLGFRLVEQLIELRNAGGVPGGERSRRYGMIANTLRDEL